MLAVVGMHLKVHREGVLEASLMADICGGRIDVIDG